MIDVAVGLIDPHPMNPRVSVGDVDGLAESITLRHLERDRPVSPDR